MQVVTLPEAFTDSNTSDFHLIDYQADRESTKQQVNLAMHTISFLQEGHKEVISDSRSTAITNAEFLVMKSGKCLMTEKFSATPESYRSVLFFFPNEAVLQFARKYEVAISKQVSHQFVQAITYDPFIQVFVESLVALDKLSAAARQQILPVKFEELMLHLTDRFGAAFISSLLVDSNPHDFHFRNVVENNKLNKLTLNELAFLSNMSLSTFKREFEKHFHQSPSKWFQEQRLDYAAFLLKDAAKRPSDIYAEVGYDSLSTFIQAFKQQFGSTPKQFQSK